MALGYNTTGFNNTAIGFAALYGTFGGSNTGFNNTAIGYQAGFRHTTGNNNVYIGANVDGVDGESNSCYIRGVWGNLAAAGIPVFVNFNNKLGTVTSSRQFKDDIKPMDKASEAILALKPVTFRYKREIDPAGIPQFGLVAEDVEKVNPELVAFDKEGKPYSVRYDQVNAMLLNEFLKEYKKVQEQGATITELKSIVTQQRKDFGAAAEQQRRDIQGLMASLKEQASQIRKVSAQIEPSKFATGRIRHGGPARKMVASNQ